MPQDPAWHEREPQWPPFEQQTESDEHERLKGKRFAQRNPGPADRDNTCSNQCRDCAPGNGIEQISVARGNDRHGEVHLRARLGIADRGANPRFVMIVQTHYQLPEAPPPPKDPPPPEKPPPPPNPPPPNPPPNPREPQPPPRNSSGHRKRPNTSQTSTMTMNIHGMPPDPLSSDADPFCSAARCTPPSTLMIACVPARTPES